MAYRTMLVALTGDSGLEPRLHTAKGLAGRFDAVLIGMHVVPLPFIPIADGEAVIYVLPELIEAQRKANQEVKERVQAAFRRICGPAPGSPRAAVSIPSRSMRWWIRSFSSMLGHRTAGDCTNTLPRGVRLTTDLSVWDAAVARWSAQDRRR